MPAGNLVPIVSSCSRRLWDGYVGGQCHKRFYRNEPDQVNETINLLGAHEQISLWNMILRGLGVIVLESPVISLCNRTIPRLFYAVGLYTRARSIYQYEEKQNKNPEEPFRFVTPA